MILKFNEDKDVILQRISNTITDFKTNTITDFKIYIKVKNEKEFLPNLLSHLSGAGFSNDELIINDGIYGIN